MTDADIEALLKDKGLIRNRLKLYSIRKNARAVLQIQEEYLPSLLCPLNEQERKSLLCQLNQVVCTFLNVSTCILKLISIDITVLLRICGRLLKEHQFKAIGKLKVGCVFALDAFLPASVRGTYHTLSLSPFLCLDRSFYALKFALLPHSLLSLSFCSGIPSPSM